MRTTAGCSALLAWAVLVAPARAGELQDDLKVRRAHVMADLGLETMLVVFSAPPRVYSLDVDYEYRQDSDLLYLTGVDQEDTILVVMPGNQTRREILFIADPDPRHEHWSGHLLTKEEAQAKSGIEAVFLRSKFDEFLAKIFNRRPFEGRREGSDPEYNAFFDALKAGRAKLALTFGSRPGPSDPLPPVYEFARMARDRFVGAAIQDATEILALQRQIKTPYERKVLARSCEISSEAHLAAMRAAKPGRFEYQVEADLEQVYLKHGAMSWGYPSIVASGPNATILHYHSSSRQMADGDLLLLDAAASYEGLTGDITRTYPVNGTFTAAQRDIYRIVQAAQDAGVRAAVAGNATADIERAAAEVARQELLKLGLVTDASGDQFRTWYTHGICHWIGMDVHDLGDYRRALAPGMAFTIEPGIYIRRQALDELPDTPENKAFIEKVRPVVEKYKGIGVRIEDSFLLTENGLERLSAKVPWKLEDVEAFLKARPAR